MSYPSTPRYKTSNWRAYNQALKQRGSLTVWLDADMQWAAQPSGKRGRQQTYSDRHPSLPDIEGPFRAAIATGHRVHGKPFVAVGIAMVCPRSQHIEPAAELAESGDPIPPQRGFTPFD